MRTILLMIAPIFAISGCATFSSSDGFHKIKPSEFYASPRTPEAVASCIARTQKGPVTVTHDETGTYRVDDTNTYGQHFSQWDIAPDGTGARISYRKQHLGGSQEAVRACF